MKSHKFLYFLAIVVFLSSCGSIKEGFVNSKKENSDEFLVEKKLPLKMPPSFNKLPIPKSDNLVNKEEEDNIEIKSLITKSENRKNNQDGKQKVNGSLKDSILEKIKEN